MTMKIKAGKTKKPGSTVKELTISAGNAMKNGFYTEAIWILSAIMEIRLKKLIMITEGKTPGAASGLEQHLKRIKLLQTREPYSLLKSQFHLSLINSLRSWKNNRNIMTKDMLEMHVSWDRKERMAKEGISLLKQLNKVYRHYKLAYHVPPPGQVHPDEVFTIAEHSEKGVKEIPEKSHHKELPATPKPHSAE